MRWKIVFKKCASWKATRQNASHRHSPRLLLTRFLVRFQFVRSELLVHEGAQLSAGREFSGEYSRHVHLASPCGVKRKNRKKVASGRTFRRSGQREKKELIKYVQCRNYKRKIYRKCEIRNHLFRCFFFFFLKVMIRIAQMNGCLADIITYQRRLFPTAFHIFDFGPRQICSSWVFDSQHFGLWQFGTTSVRTTCRVCVIWCNKFQRLREHGEIEVLLQLNVATIPSFVRVHEKNRDPVRGQGCGFTERLALQQRRCLIVSVKSCPKLC